MGKSRRSAADGDSRSQDDTQQQQSLLELMLASMCVAVECQSQGDQEKLVAEDPLMVSYREATWKLPIERALQSVNAWSLAKFQSTKTVFQREIVYPPDAKPVPDEELQQQQQQEEAKELDASKQQLKEKKTAKKKQHKKRQRATRSEGGVQELFRVGRIDEDPLETRWDHRGNPVPLRNPANLFVYVLYDALGRNILGEHYAPRSDPLQFIKSASSRSPSEIYQQMKRAVREDLVTREKRRIQALNDREKLRKQQAGELSPEAALEAKFDRMFVESSSGNNSEPLESPSEMTKGGGRAFRDDDGEEDLGGEEENKESGDDDTDEASDSESNQQQTPVALRVN